MDKEKGLKETVKKQVGQVKERLLENKKVAVETMTKNKRVTVEIIAVIIAIVSIVFGAVWQNRNNMKNMITPELAKAMTYDQVEKGEEAVEGTENVKFDAFFLRDLDGDGYAESVRGTCREIGKQDTLYMEINVQTAGYLKDAKITVNGGNFYLQTALPKDQELQENYIGNNIKEIRFNQLQNGTQKLLTGIVRSGDYSRSSARAEAIGNNINNYSKVNSVTLTGTYVEGDQEIEITKTVNFNIDWYGTTTASIYSTSQSANIDNAINEEQGTINLGFTVYTQETNQVLMLKDNHVELDIPELNGYAPISVVYTDSNARQEYNAETRKLTIDRESAVGEDGTILSALGRSNSYSVLVTYPLEAYQTMGTESVQLRIPVQTYYEGYNNPSTEFSNPYKSNIASTTIVANYRKPVPPVEHVYSTSFEVKVGRTVYDPIYRYMISKQKPLRLYNGESEEERDDIYTVMWKGFVGTKAKLDGMTMKETPNGQAQVSDQFIKTNATQESMEDVTTNVGIYFQGADALVGADGWIKVYDDETGDLIETFTKDTWNNYSAGNPYRYKTPVKHIRVETSAIVRNETYFYVYNIKELDDEKITTKYEKEQFDELKYIKSTLVGYLAGEQITVVTHQANYEAPISIANIRISKNTISTQGTEKNDKITIQTVGSASNNQVEWLNGTFLVKIPQEIIDIEINSVTINNRNVRMESYEIIEQNGQKFIKIVTKNDTPQTYTITIDANLSPDPRIATTTRPIELYATNENGSEYYYKAQDIYDVNNNTNTIEQVNYRTTNITMVSPNSLLTNQTATNYDEKNSIVISPQVADIKPSYAVVDQEQEEKTATIGVQIKNNYASTISEIQLLGKIPFEGNTYVINGEDLGSTFTTKMTEAGIQLPEELKEVAKVYYSENEKPDREISKESNGWKTADQVENWDNIKTFLIDLGNYVMPTGKEYVFNYVVKIPNGLEFNKESYSHHGVYFSLDTENGKYRTQTEPNKLGFRIAEKYDLELIKNHKGKEKLVAGATYKITEIITNEEGNETEGTIKTAVTNSEGKLKIANLYTEKTYEIQEIKTPDNYELNPDVIRFTGHTDDKGVLTIEKHKGTTKDDIEVIKNENENYKVTVKVEDEAKATLKITKKEQGTENTIARVRYKITGHNLPEKGRTLTTNTSGETILKGLSINEEYTLQEVKAEGYYLANPIKFKIVNQEGTYQIQLIEGTITAQQTIEEDSIPTIQITLEDEKIPTYNLEITKIKKTTESTLSNEELMAKAEAGLAQTEVTYLEGAKFVLYKGTQEIGRYTTDSEGKITIENLYQYVTEKDVDQTYTLKEALAPDGYAKVKDITFKVEEIDGTLQFQEVVAEGSTAKTYTVDGNTVKLIIEDSPTFKLVKKDKETKQPIANVKFAIYNVEDGDRPAKNSKGEILGTKEIIDGKEYYTVSTDENGIITADLTEGLYKAVEVEAPEQYDIRDQIHYFGIGASREGETTLGDAEWAKGIGGSDNDNINSVIETRDGGYLVGGSFRSKTIDLGNGIILSNEGSYSDDGMVIKYNIEGEIEWAKAIGNKWTDRINSVIETSDGGYLVGGCFSTGEVDLGNGVKLTTKGGTDGMIIKYSSEGETEWAKGIGGSSSVDEITSVIETSDGGYLVGGYFSSSTIDLGNGVSLTNQGSYIIKYNVNREAEWAKQIGKYGNQKQTSLIETTDKDYLVSDDNSLIKYSYKGEIEWAKVIGESSSNEITSIIETSDGGYMAGGCFSGDIQLGNGVRLESNGTVDGMIIKYSSEGEVEWARKIGGRIVDRVTSVIETKEGGYLVGGYFASDTINLENKVSLNSKGEFDGMLIKYSFDGKVEWAEGIGGSEDDYIYSVIEISDGGYLVGGDFESSTIDLENGVSLKNKGSYDGMLIKYKSIQIPEIVTKQARTIGGSEDDRIISTIETKDGGYLVGGYFKSSTIDLGNGVSLNNRGDYDGIVIKYNSEWKAEWAKGIGESGSDYIQSITETKDGGYLIGGYFASNTIDLGNGVSLSNSGNYDGMVIKYNSKGNVEWAKAIGESKYEYINSVIETKDGGYLIGGHFSSSTIDLENGVSLNNIGSYDGMVIKYSVNGNVEWAKSIGGSNEEQIAKIIETREGDYVIAGRFSSSTIDLKNNISLTNKGDFDEMIIKYSTDGEVKWAKAVGGDNREWIETVIETKDGGYLVGGYFKSSTIDLGNGVTLTNNGSTEFFDGMMIKYSTNGEIEWAKVIGGNGNDDISSVIETSDGSYLVGGYFSSDTISLEEGVKITGQGGINWYDAMVIKYKDNGKAEWTKVIGGNGNDYIKSVIQTKDGGYTIGGYFGSSTINLGNGVILNKVNSFDGMMIKIREEIGVFEVQQLTVENTRKEYKITTDVKEIAGIKGGSISGEDYTSYEKVKHGDNSTKEIIMTPEENYEIIGITVNGKEHQFTANADGTYSMPVFENMTEDKHIEVMYALKENKIIINKIDSKTKAPLEGATFRLDQIEEKTETESETESGTEAENVTDSVDEVVNEVELYHTEVTTNSQGQAITQIPFGKYQITEIQAPEGYELNEEPQEIEFRADGNHEFTIENSEKAKVLVHHYKAIQNEGGGYTYTEEKLAEDERQEGKIDTQYTTAPNLDIQKYELIKDAEGNYILPENATGTFVSGTTEVKYYYVEKEIPLIVHHYIEGTTNKVPLKDGTEAEDENAKGKEGTPYTTNTINNETLSENYELVEIPENAEGVYGENEIVVTYYYKKVQRDVVLNKYNEDKTETLQGAKFTITKKGEEVNAETKTYTTNAQGKIQLTLEAGEYVATEIQAPEGYKLPENAQTEFVITRETENVQLDIANTRKQGTVIIHHYVEGTTEKVPSQEEGKVVEDIIQTGNIGDIYASKVAENVDSSYIFVKSVGKTSGEYKEETQEIIYYYKQPVKNVTINKIWVDNEIQAQRRPESITIQLKDGDIVVKEQQITEANGWSYTFENVPIYKNGVEIEYTVDEKETNTGDLKFYSKEVNPITEGQATITNTFTKPTDTISIKVNKAWVDQENVYKKRPETITLQVKNKDTIDTIVSEQVITKENATENDRKNWTYTFENLPKYNENGQEIEYTVDEKETNENDLFYYTKQIGEMTDKEEVQTNEENKTTPINNTKEITITNTMTKTPAFLEVKYLDINTKEEITEKVEKEGIVGEPYDVTEDKKEIEGYTLVKEPEEKTGTYTEEKQTKIYYYVKNTKVIVKYLEKDNTPENNNDNKVLAEQEVIEGYEGKEYKTSKKTIEDYTFVESTKNTEGQMTREIIEVIYYYAKNTKATVQHIDITTGEILKEETTPGKVGDIMETNSEDFEGYVLVKEPENLNVTMTEEEQIVKYYYAKISAGVIEKHIDEMTGEILYNKKHEGKEGDSYNILPKEFEGYELLEQDESGKNRLPENATGTMKQEVIEVKYYYIKKVGGVIEKHIDMDTGKILEEEEHKGKVGDKYDIPSKEFKGYELVKEKMPTNSKGEMTEKEIEVIYYYRKLAKVKVEYIDNKTGEKLDEEEIKGYVGNPYETEEKEFEGYELVKEKMPTNNKGEMTEKEIVVRYYYERRAEIEVQYLEKGTKQKLADSEEIKGYVGDHYETKEKVIKYYKLVDKTANTTGEMTKNKITVIYYYEKQIFNLSVDKWLSKVNVNGAERKAQSYETRDQLYKLDIHRTKVNTANVKLTYTIRITNTGEIEGTVGTINEIIPQGYSFHQEDNTIQWKEENGKLTTECLKDEKMQAGQYKEIEIVLRWNTGEGNFGRKENTVTISNLSNPAEYKETNEKDNSAKSEMLITIATGLDKETIETMIKTLMLMVSAGAVLVVIKMTRTEK